MKNQTTILTFLIVILFSINSFKANAQTCNAVMLSETGTVLSAKKGQVSVMSSADKATVKIKKTSGRAKTDVRVYVDGNLVNSDLNFANGNYTSGYRTKVLNNVNGKNIMVQIDNKSVGHTFGYEVIIEGETRSIMNPAGLQTGKVTYFAAIKSYITNTSCGNRTRVIVRRTKPGGAGQIEIREQDASKNFTVLKHRVNLEAGDDRKIIDVNSKQKLKISIIQMGTATFDYTVNALSLN
jgi:hypothetical protein